MRNGRAESQTGPRSDCPAGSDCPITTVTPASPTSLAASELVFAIEEERMAHDVYAAAAARWDLRVFENIVRSEAQHAAALERLAAASGIDVPEAVTGIYHTADLQQLHDSLLNLVNESETAALRAGALLEETDIADLRRATATATDPGTLAVLSNLEGASNRHLSAFVQNLKARGIAYAPQVLAKDDFDTVLGNAGRGRGGRCGSAGAAGCNAGGRGKFGAGGPRNRGNNGQPECTVNGGGARNRGDR